MVYIESEVYLGYSLVKTNCQGKQSAPKLTAAAMVQCWIFCGEAGLKVHIINVTSSLVVQVYHLSDALCSTATIP